MSAPDDLQRGRLEQACGACGRWEAAGSYCSGCYRPMTAADWYPNGQQGRRAAARQMAAGEARAPLTGGRSDKAESEPTTTTVVA